MKKLLFIMPLLAISSLTSCGDWFDDNLLTEQEFVDAISFKDVKYLQTENNDPIRGGFIFNALSPSVTRKYATEDDKEIITHDEYYSEEDDGVYCYKLSEGKYIKSPATKPLPTPQDIGGNLLWCIRDKTKDDFTYDKAKDEYCTTYVDIDDKEYYAVTKFLDKKLISITRWLVTGQERKDGMVAAFTYKEETPELPEVK